MVVFTFKCTLLAYSHFPSWWLYHMYTLSVWFWWWWTKPNCLSSYLYSSWVSLLNSFYFCLHSIKTYKYTCIFSVNYNWIFFMVNSVFWMPNHTFYKACINILLKILLNTHWNTFDLFMNIVISTVLAQWIYWYGNSLESILLLKFNKFNY